MKVRTYKLCLALFLGFMLSFSSAALAMDSVSVTVTLKIEPFQQLILKSENSAVTVSEGNDEGISKVRLDEVNDDQVRLEPAISAGVKSTLGWELLAHTENSYVADGNGKNYSSGPGLDLKIPNPPGSVEVGGSRVGGSWISVGREKQSIASGGPGFYEPFDIHYKLDFSEAALSSVKGAGVDVVYTMMEL